MEPTNKPPQWPPCRDAWGNKLDPVTGKCIAPFEKAHFYSPVVPIVAGAIIIVLIFILLSLAH